MSQKNEKLLQNFLHILRKHIYIYKLIIFLIIRISLNTI